MMPSSDAAHDLNSLEAFCDGLRTRLAHAAAETGASDPTALFDVVWGITGGPGHAGGHVIYALRRYQTRPNQYDLETAASWLYLLWRKGGRDG